MSKKGGVESLFLLIISLLIIAAFTRSSMILHSVYDDITGEVSSDIYSEGEIQKQQSEQQRQAIGEIMVVSAVLHEQDNGRDESERPVPTAIDKGEEFVCTHGQQPSYQSNNQCSRPGIVVVMGQCCREQCHGFAGKWRGVHKGSHTGDINLVGQIQAVPVIDELRVNTETDEEQEQNEKQGRAGR